MITYKKFAPPFNNPGRFGNSPNGSPTVGVYQAKDGPLYMACANDRLYRR